MKTQMNSKERILRTIEWKETDHLPLAINGIGHSFVVDLNNKLKGDAFKISDYCLEMGTDTDIRIQLPVVFPPEVSINYSTQRISGEKNPILTKEYVTPKGRLIQAVRKNEHYPFDKIELFSDHLVPPERSYKYMVDNGEELDVLECVLSDPEDGAFPEAWEFAKKAKQYANDRGVVFTGNLEGIGDPLLWLSGLENIVFMGTDEPEALHRYIDILSAWNINRIRVLIDMGVDIIVRRGWYESSDFWSPEMYREFLLPALKKEVEIVRNAGLKYAYIMNTGVDALADLIVETGVDMQTNAEPEKSDFIGLRKTFQNKVAMCSGINNYHVIEAGSETDIDNAVRYAVENYAPGGGFIMGPSDAIGGVGLSSGRVSEKILKNVHCLVDAWKRYCLTSRH